ncbi:MAG: MCE family protein, partial [Magnetococcales bacterium]|nr:MCE family protein [Magnetococcales bacterium]
MINPGTHDDVPDPANSEDVPVLAKDDGTHMPLTDSRSPVIKKRSGPSMVWLIPLITAIIGGWLIFKTLSEQGPVFTITFETADGIEAGKTKIKYKNVEIGHVESVRFSEDFTKVHLTTTLNKEAKSFLRRGTRFWVVRPRLSLRGASGLGTLVSGAYIEIDPGPGAPQKHFVGLEEPPVITADQHGRKVILMSPKLGSIDTGSPLYYQGMLAGEVLGHELANDQKNVFIHVFIKAPYHEMVHGNTRFWNVSGVDISMGADGFQM